MCGDHFPYLHKSSQMWRKNVKVAFNVFLKNYHVAIEILGQVEKTRFSVRCETFVTSHS